MVMLDDYSSIISGLIEWLSWGGIAGVFTWWLYDQIALGLVMTEQ